MNPRIIPLLALTFQIVLGNFCFMQMTSAAMPPDIHSAGTQMNMPEMSMPASECEHCSKQVAVTEEQPKAVDCSNGHCFMHASTNESSSLQIPQPPIVATDRLPAVTPSFVTVTEPVRQDSTAPPGFHTNTETIVLRY